MKTNVAVVIPSWDAKDEIKSCLKSLQSQTVAANIIVVDNGSSDGSAEHIKQNFPKVDLIELPTNHGFTGGVNVGIKRAMEQSAQYIILLNNDAVADKKWLDSLVDRAEKEPRAGIITSKILRTDKKHLDSTGEFYSVWGLPFPRGRNEIDKNQYDGAQTIFAASGGASLYKVEMLKQIGLFDDDFFAYFEDVDISFRAQLAGWKVVYEPSAIVYHQIGVTSSRLGDFTTYHSAKNFMLLYAKNMPLKLYLKYLPLFTAQLVRWMLSSLLRGKFLAFARGILAAIRLHFSTVKKRRRIQSSRKVSVKYIDSVLYHHRPSRPPLMEVE